MQDVCISDPVPIVIQSTPTPDRNAIALQFLTVFAPRILQVPGPARDAVMAELMYEVFALADAYLAKCAAK